MEFKKHEKIEEILEDDRFKSEWFDTVPPTTNTEEDEGKEQERQAEAKEYLDILMDLSADFTNIEAKTGRAIRYDTEGNARIVGPGYFGGKFNIDNVIRKAGIEDVGFNASSEEDPYKSDDPYIDRRYSLQIADEILRADKDLADTVEYVIESKRKKKKAKEAKEEHKEEEQNKNIGKRVLGLPWYMKEKGRIQKRVLKFHASERQGREHIAAIQTRLSSALSKAYSKERCYGRGENDERVKKEMHRNWDIWYDRFLGDDERKQKIQRAHELRAKINV